jgi:ribonuclease P protein component
MKKFRVKNRIKKKTEISDIFRRGKKYKCCGFKIIYRENEEKFDRLAILVSRKTGTAVKRNSIKRFFREIFRKNRIEFPPYFDILIQPQSGIELNNEMVQCYKKWLENAKKLLL